MEDLVFMAQVFNHISFIAAGYGMKMDVDYDNNTISFKDEDKLNEQQYLKFIAEVNDYLYSKGCEEMF